MYEVDFSDLGEMLNKWIKKIWNCRTRYVICKGGGGSGKSYGIVQMLVYRCIAEPGHRFLVVRKVGKTIRESIFALIQEVISGYGCTQLFKINKTDMTIECINGNKFIFSGIDDVEKLKSIQGITDVVIEEGSELEVGDFRQLNIRLRGRSRWPKQMFVMFNPISITHWLKKEFFDVKKDDATVVETTYRDNRFLDDEAKKVLEDFKNTDEYFYMVYCCNQWGVVGKTVFSASIVQNRMVYLQEHSQVKKRGYFVFEYENEKIVDETIEFICTDDGPITLYEDPLRGYPYVAGGDTAGEGSDFFSLHVVNNVTGNQAAVLHQQYDEDLYARQVYCLGKYYNYALVGLEVNFSTHPTKELERLGYINQYTRERPDTYTGAVMKTYGFMTGKITRPRAIANLVQLVRESVETINDIKTLEEMLTFVKNPDTGKPEAEEGSHDDLIMGLAITHIIREQGSFEIQINPEEKVIKLADKLGIKKRI